MIDIPLRPSLLLLLFIYTIHGLAALALLFTQLPPLLYWIFAIVLCASLAGYCWKWSCAGYGERIYYADGKWRVVFAGVERNAHLIRALPVSVPFIALRFRCAQEWHQRTMIVCKDSCNKQHLWQLRHLLFYVRS